MHKEGAQWLSGRVLESNHTYAQRPPLNTHADSSSRTKGLEIGQSLNLHQYFGYASSEGSCEPADLYSLAWAFIAEQWDKYQNPMI